MPRKPIEYGRMMRSTTMEPFIVAYCPKDKLKIISQNKKKFGTTTISSVGAGFYSISL